MRGTEGRAVHPQRLLAVAAALAALFAGERARAAEIPPVVASLAFQVSSPYRISYEELSGLVAVRPGGFLTREAIRESIRGLYSKALFREVAAYVREEDGRAHVRFVLRPEPLIEDIEVRGGKKVGQAQVLSAAHIRRGATLDDRDLAEAEEDVRTLLRRRGFPDGSASIVATCSVERGSGKVVIDIREGAPATVRSVSFPGATRFSPERIAAIVKVEAGEPFDFGRWEEGVQALRREYKRAGHLTVRIAEADVACEEGPGVCLKAAVEEGPLYAVTWSGNRRISTSRLEDASGIYGDDVTTEGPLVHDVRERLIAFYHDEDYLEADVEVSAGTASEEPRPFRISVTEGPKNYIRKILFAGNASIPASRLERQMISAPRGTAGFLTGSGKFREETWNEDLKAILGLYQKEGFARARIAAVETARDGRGGMTKTIRIEEGPRYRLATVSFRGNDHFLAAELIPLVGNRPGEMLDYPGIDRDRDAVAGFYRNAGYLDVQVTVVVDLDDAKGEAAVRFETTEGPRYRLGSVVVRGNLLTDSVVVLRELEIPRGDPAGEDRLIRFQQAVYRTGMYRTVRVQRVKHPLEETVDIVIEVEETLFFKVEFGGGWGTDTGVRGFVGAETLNLDGKGRRLGARVQASEKEQVYLARLREPWVLGNRWKWEGILTGSYSITDEESFDLRKTSVIAGINKDIFGRSSVAFQYELSEEVTFNVAPGAVLSPEDQGHATISAFRGLFVLDFRDDPFNPRRGSFNSASAEVAGRFLGGEVDYFKTSAQSSWYIPVPRRNTFVVSARAGYALPYGVTEEIPIQKRFFLGGRTTVRGFDERSVGPKGPDGSPIGGDTMVNGNAEFRVPLRYGLLVAAFLDVGSVWIREDPRYAFDLREGAGLGLRYVTPIGPVAFDYGWKLDRRADESPSEWHFTIGAVF